MHEFYKIKNNYAPPIKRSSLKFRENTSNFKRKKITVNYEMEYLAGTQNPSKLRIHPTNNPTRVKTQLNFGQNKTVSLGPSCEIKRYNSYYLISLKT